MHLLLALLASASTLLATSYTANTSGDWASPTTWSGAGVPGNGDTCTISNGVTVTANDAEICGNSPTAGTVVLNLNNTGRLVISGTGSLKVRGDVQYCAASSSVTSDWGNFQTGSIFEFDSSLNPTQKYSVYPCGDNIFRGLTVSGTLGAGTTIQSNAGGANGYFSLHGHSFGGRYIMTYVNVLRVGDATNPAFAQETGTTDGGAQWDVQHSTFTSSGLAPSASCSLAADDVFRHSYNVHVDSQGASVFTRPDLCGSITAIGANGVREIAANVFDKLADSSLDARDFTISSNYFTGLDNGLTIVNYLVHGWAKWQNNFYHVTAGSSSLLQLQGDAVDSVFILDEPNSSNPHGVLLGGSSGETVSGNVIESTGQLTSSRSSFIITNITLAAAEYSVKNNLLLPNAAGGMTWWLSAVFGAVETVPSPATFVFDHNTVVTDESEGYALVTNHNPDVTITHQITSYKANILWNPSGVTNGYKLFAETADGVDACAPAACDYNNGYNVKTDGGGYTGGANGYAATFSGPPGTHDLSVNPMFYDSSRNTATFDSAYLGNHPTAWNSGASYSIGDMAEYIAPSGEAYAGSRVNYRYINESRAGTPCSSANPHPGAFTLQARACWEMASLYRIREGVAAQTLYDDQTIGASGVDIITVLIGWIRAGWSPRHPSLAFNGSDGLAFGAVQPTFAAPTFPSGNTVGLKIRGNGTRGAQGR